MKKVFYRFVHFFILSCPEATINVEKELLGDLGPIQRLRLKCHIIACKWCRSYLGKTLKIHHTMKDMFINRKQPINRHVVDIDGLKKGILNKIEKR